MTTEQTNLRLVLAGLLLAILMAAMDNAIVATAPGSILADLGGVDSYVWITSAYAVAVLAGMPIFGKLSDMYRRKCFFVFGLLVFLIGSALCGIAQSIPQLAVYRAIQGIGGALMPIAFTIVFDVFPAEQHGKMTGMLGTVFGASSVIGPLLGAFITDAISWHWVFYVNVPTGIVALLLIGRFYEETPVHIKQKIDWAGAVTLVTAVVSLMFALELGGKEFAWTSWQSILLFGLFAVFIGLFYGSKQKRKSQLFRFGCFAAAAYFGWQTGAQTIDEAPEMKNVAKALQAVLNETGRLLVTKYGFDQFEHDQYIQKIIGRFANPHIHDDITRVGRAPIRKLGGNDRLLSPAKQYEQMPGETPVYLAKSIAAVLLYDYVQDPEAVEVQGEIEHKGIESALKKFTQLDESDPLFAEVMEQYESIREKGI